MRAPRMALGHLGFAAVLCSCWPGEAVENGCVAPSGMGNDCTRLGSDAGNALLARRAVVTQSATTLTADSDVTSLLEDLRQISGDLGPYESKIRGLAKRKVARAKRGKGARYVPASSVNEIVVEIERKISAAMRNTQIEEQHEILSQARYVDDCQQELNNFASAIEHGMNLSKAAAERHAQCVEEHNLSQCGKSQAAYHAAACDVTGRADLQCSRYKECYEREVGRYKKVEARLKVAETGRQHEAVSVERVKCYLKSVLTANSTALAAEGDARLARCNTIAGYHASANITIAYPEPQVLLDCPWQSWLDGHSAKCSPTPTPTPPGPTPASPFCAGSTPAGSTAWTNDIGKGIYVDVDTSICGFADIPVYVTSMGSNGSLAWTTGSSEIYEPKAGGFRIHVKLDGLTPALANEKGYHINWIADRKGDVPSNASCSGSASMWKQYAAQGIFNDVDASGCGFQTTPVYITSMVGNVYHESRGSSELYLYPFTSFRNYIFRQEGITTQNASEWGWKINWIGHDSSRNFEGACSGSTPPGATEWKQHDSAFIITLHVDTSACGFKNPVYVTSLVGFGGAHWASQGSSELYEESATGFRVYIKSSSGVSPEYVNQKALQWHLNWVGAEAM